MKSIIILAATALFVGCYSGARPMADTGSTEATATVDVPSDSGNTGADETGTTESQTVHFEGFLPGRSLELEIPNDWTTGQYGSVFSVASFPPPHMGMAGTLPEGLLVELLPHASFSAQELSPTEVAGWMQVSPEGRDPATVKFVNPAEEVSFFATMTAQASLDENDLTAVLDILRTVRLGEE